MESESRSKLTEEQHWQQSNELTEKITQALCPICEGMNGGVVAHALFNIFAGAFSSTNNSYEDFVRILNHAAIEYKYLWDKKD